MSFCASMSAAMLDMLVRSCVARECLTAGTLNRSEIPDLVLRCSARRGMLAN